MASTDGPYKDSCLWINRKPGLDHEQLGKSGRLGVIDKKTKLTTEQSSTSPAASQSRSHKKEIAQSLDTCFRVEALRWRNNEVDRIRRGLILGESMDEWTTSANAWNVCLQANPSREHAIIGSPTVNLSPIVNTIHRFIITALSRAQFGYKLLPR
jgi:hypothetical protein